MEEYSAEMCLAEPPKTVGTREKAHMLVKLYVYILGVLLELLNNSFFVVFFKKKMLICK